MLTARASRARDWLTFALVALAPALLIALLGVRALRNEEAATTREVARSLEAAGERLGRAVDRDIDEATERLRAATLEGGVERVAAALAPVAPRIAEPVIVSSARAVLWPPPPSAAARLPATAARACADLLERFGSLRTAEERGPVRADILGRCADAQTETGRWVWPLVALEQLAPEDGERVSEWLDRHAALLAPAERDATRLALESAPVTPTVRARAARALEAPGTRRQLLADELARDGATAALRRALDASHLVTWRVGSSIGVLRPLSDGSFAGFIVHRSTLADALSSGYWVADTAQRIEIIGPAKRAEGTHAESAELAAIVPLASELGLRVVPRDPRAVVRLAARSRALLAVMAVGATVAAFGVAAVLFARMRAAKRSSELRTDFVSAVSHELRTPIASVRMLAELLAEDRIDPAERAEVHATLADEARRLGETVDRLLGFSRMAAGRYVLAREPAKLADIVEASIATFEKRHPESAPIAKELDLDVVASVDAAQIRLAIDNLLENARKYAPQGTPYRVRTYADTSAAAIEVSDRGPGVARRDHRRIFRPFERADDRLSRATEGSGIGLSLVRHVAEAHGGRVALDSDVGQGARFTIRIPRTNAGGT